MKKFFYALLGLAVATTFVAQGVYLYKFGSLRDPTLSPSLETWGQYGDYLGGTLGTYFGFLAFLGVLVTVMIQRQQLEHARSQSKLDEIQRFLATHAAKIDELLHSPPKIPPSRLENMLQGRPLPLSLHAMLLAAMTLKLGVRSDIPRESGERMTLDILECLRRDTPIIVIEMQHLTTALELYEKNEGSDDISTLYRNRYESEVGCLHSLGLLCSERVSRYFKAYEVSERMIRDAPLNAAPAAEGR